MRLGIGVWFVGYLVFIGVRGLVIYNSIVGYWLRVLDWELERSRFEFVWWFFVRYVVGRVIDEGRERVSG